MTIKELCDRKGKIVLQLLHGRDDPDEQLDDWGYLGPALHIDWIHITYNSDISLGIGEDVAMGLIAPPNATCDWIWMQDAFIVVRDTGKVSYYGDWEITAAVKEEI